MMNSWHVKSLDYLLGQYFESQQCDFSYDADLKKVNPLIQRKLAYTTTQFSMPCSVFLKWQKMEQTQVSTPLLRGEAALAIFSMQFMR